MNRLVFGPFFRYRPQEGRPLTVARTLLGTLASEKSPQSILIFYRDWRVTSGAGPPGESRNVGALIIKEYLPVGGNSFMPASARASMAQVLSHSAS
jgi:hypothetical protein